MYDARLGILGTTALLLDGGPDDSWGKPRERAVLAVLLVHAGDVVPLEELVRWVWPRDKPVPLDPGTVFDVYLGRVRRALARLPVPPRVEVVDGGYRIVVEPDAVDVHLFHRLIVEAQAEPESARVVDLVEQALWLWRGLPLADAETEPAREWRDRILRDEWLAAHAVRVRALFDLNRYDEALDALDELLTDFPDDLHLVHLTLTGLYQQQRHADATRLFLMTWRRLRAGGEDRAALHLRRHHQSLAGTHVIPVAPQVTVVPQQLPPDIPGFVGRRQELASLDDAAAETVPVLLEGPGGVGKTAVAIRWAHRVKERFPGGVVFVDVRGASPVDELLAALGQTPEPALSVRQREKLLALLTHDRRMLVILDDVQNADQLRRLGGLLQSCVVVATSRQRLPLAGAVVRRIAVTPLDEECARVFLAVRSFGRVTDTARLSGLCGGLPLLLSVLAAQLTGGLAAHPDDLVVRIDRRRRLALVGEDGIPAPHGEACLVWAYRELDAPERRLFRLLAVHPGKDISVESAIACDDRTPSATLTSLTHLAAAGLLRPSDQLDRFARHEVLAEFAGRCLDRDDTGDERRAAWERLLTFLTETAVEAELVGGEGDMGEWFRTERATLLAAVRRAYETGSHDHVLRLADAVAGLLERTGAAVEAPEVRTLALRSARALGRGEAEALYRLGISYEYEENFDAASRCLEAVLRAAPDERLALTVVHRLGRLAARCDDTAVALAWYRRGVAMAERLADDGELMWLHCRIGVAMRVATRLDEALHHLRTARMLACRVGDAAAVATCLAELGAVSRELGEGRAAVANCEEALAVAESISDLSLAARIHVTLAGISRDQRRFDEAVKHGRRAVDLLRGAQDVEFQARVVEALGDALHHSGEPHQAVGVWQEAADLYDHAGLPAFGQRMRGKMANDRNPRSAPTARAAVRAPDPAVLPREVVDGVSG